MTRRTRRAMMHPRAVAGSIARGVRALRGITPPLAVEAESGRRAGSRSG